MSTNSRPAIIKDMVSTIIPVYNRESMLVDAVQSVLEQNYTPIEIIIIDDGSTDDTLVIAERIAAEHTSVSCLSIENSGPGAAREAGRQLARGEYIQYLDSDDLLLPGKFSKQVEVLKKNQDYGVCYCKTNVFITSENKTITNWKRTGEKIQTMIPAMLASRWWDTSTPLFRRSVTDAAGPWKSLINEEDWEYDCRIGFTNGALGYVPEVLSLQRMHNEPRLSQEGAIDPRKLKSRAIARHSIIELASQDERALMSQEFNTLLVYTFLLVRQCGAAGLNRESEMLFKLIRPLLAKSPKYAVQLLLYQTGARLAGWHNIARLATYLDGLRA